MQKYIKLFDQIQKINQKHDLSPNEINLLNSTAKAHFSKEAIFVGDLIYQHNIAAQATLHKALKKLVDKKLLSLKVQKDDVYHKRVMLTKPSLEHFKRLDRAMNLTLEKSS